MKKLLLLMGFAAGFVCGSKAGTRPYEEIEMRVLAVTRRPKVRAAVQEARDRVEDLVDSVDERVGPSAAESAA